MQLKRKEIKVVSATSSQLDHALQIRMCHHQHKWHAATGLGFAGLISSFKRLIPFEPGNRRRAEIKVCEALTAAEPCPRFCLQAPTDIKCSSSGNTSLHGYCHFGFVPRLDHTWHGIFRRVSEGETSSTFLKMWKQCLLQAEPPREMCALLRMLSFASQQTSSTTKPSCNISQSHQCNKFLLLPCADLIDSTIQKDVQKENKITHNT